MTDLLDARRNIEGQASGHAPAVGEDSGLAMADAPELLSDLGYLLVHGSPSERDPAYLLVAIRPRPTRAHFDPERIEYWTAGNELAEPATLEWPMAAPSERYSWGAIKVIDRTAALNVFVSFGGSLRVGRDGLLCSALFRSDAPILAVSGRGEAGDPLAASVLGFFARLRAACGAEPELARHVSALDPVAVYAAYLVQALDLWGSNAWGRNASNPNVARIRSRLRSDLCLLGRDFSSSATAGESLVRRLKS